MNANERDIQELIRLGNKPVANGVRWWRCTDGVRRTEGEALAWLKKMKEKR